MNRKYGGIFIILILLSLFITFYASNVNINPKENEYFTNDELEFLKMPLSSRFGVNYIDINNIIDYFSPSNLYDNDISTFWASRIHTNPDAYEWVEIKFDRLTYIKNVSFIPRSDFICFPSSFQIQISNSGLTWTSLYDFHSFSSSNLNDYTFTIDRVTKHIRIVANELTYDGSNYYFQIAEISIFDTTHKILINNSNIFVSSVLITSYSQHDWRYLTDGIVSGFLDQIWSSGVMYENSTEWIQLDIGGAYLVNNITLYPSINGMGFPRNFQILGSNDTITWNILASYTNYSQSSEPVSLTFSPIHVRYVRILASKAYSAYVAYNGETYNYFQLNEVEIRLNNGINLAGAPKVSSCAGRNPYFTFDKFNSLMSNFKLKLVRIGFLWTYFEKSKGVLNIDPVATMMIDNLISRGYTLIGVLGLGNPLYDGGGAPVTDEAVSAFANYARFVVHNYKNYVKYWEVWNEPNFGFWIPVNATAYGNLYLCTAQAIHLEDPEAKVLLGATALFDFNFISTILKNPTIAQEVDVVSIHPYRLWSGELPEGPSFYIEDGVLKMQAKYSNYIQEYTAFKNMVHSYAPQADIWITELGWQVSDPYPSGVDEYTQAAYIIRSMLLSFHLNITKHTIFSLVDDLRPSDYSYGILNYSYVPRPAYYAINNLIDIFGSNVVSTSKIGITIDVSSGTVYHTCLINRNKELYIPIWSNTTYSVSINISIDLNVLSNSTHVILTIMNPISGSSYQITPNINNGVLYLSEFSASMNPAILKIQFV